MTTTKTYGIVVLVLTGLNIASMGQGEGVWPEGLLWWNNADGTLKDVPRDAYWSWGLYDSLIVVIPSLDMVVARAGKSLSSTRDPHYAPIEPVLAPIATDFVGVNIRTESGERRGDGARGPKASGMHCVDGVLYMLVRNTGNSQVAWSADHARTSQWCDWKFETSFGAPTFLNFGRNYAGARDNYVYLYSNYNDSASRIHVVHVTRAVSASTRQPNPGAPGARSTTTRTGIWAPAKPAVSRRNGMSDDGRTCHLLFSGNDCFSVRKVTLGLEEE